MIPGPVYVEGAGPSVPPYAPAFAAPPFVFVSGCVPKTTVYHRDIGPSDGMNVAYRRALGEHGPARTTVQIGPMSRAESLIETEAVAWKREE